MRLGGRDTRWTLIRHAAVKAPPGVILGRLDVEADLSDRVALDLLAACLPADSVRLTSPLARARMTAQALLPPGGDLIEEPELTEQHFGDWQGMTHDEVAAHDPAGAAAFWKAPMRNAPPGGESFADCCARVGAALPRLSARWPGRAGAAGGDFGVLRAAMRAAVASASTGRRECYIITDLRQICLPCSAQPIVSWRNERRRRSSYPCP